jgi:hypothetical protein
MALTRISPILSYPVSCFEYGAVEKCHENLCFAEHDFPNVPVMFVLLPLLYYRLSDLPSNTQSF